MNKTFKRIRNQFSFIECKETALKTNLTMNRKLICLKFMFGKVNLMWIRFRKVMVY